MSPRSKISSWLIAGFLIGLALFLSSKGLAVIPGHSRTASELGAVSEVVSIIRQNYVEDVTPGKLISGALSGMVKVLDPYSQYLDNDAFEELKVDTAGVFGGIGVEVSVKGGVLRVISPLEGTPARQAGLKPGDVILKIDGVTTREMSLEEAVKRLRGKPGTVAQLTVMREGESKLAEFSIPRDIIHIKSVAEAKLVGDHIGYIKLAAFQEESARDLEQALKKLESQGMRGLILDLRNNAGGLFDVSVAVSEEFIPRGKLIVSTRGRDPKSERRFVSQQPHTHAVQPLVVLVNKGSASGSEILAGAVQDHRVGVVIGAKTFGKGSIQSVIPLKDKTALRLTTSRYYTPSGRLIHDIGITPDIVLENGDEKAGVDPVLEKAIQVAAGKEGAAA